MVNISSMLHLVSTGTSNAQLFSAVMYVFIHDKLACFTLGSICDPAYICELGDSVTHPPRVCTVKLFMVGIEMHVLDTDAGEQLS
jgi:hypothetical protein